MIGVMITQGSSTPSYMRSNPGPWTLNPEPCTLHPEPCTLHPAPCTLNPELGHAMALEALALEHNQLT